MKEKIVTTAQWLALAFFSVSFLAACETATVKEDDTSTAAESYQGMTKEQIVEKRFNGYWGALLEENFEKAYAYLSPATRKTLSAEAFQSNFGAIKYKNAEFKEIKCEEDVCLVRFVLTYDYGRVKDIPTWTGEKWFFLDGQAWVNFSN
jgi:hypothetical protein